MRILLLLGVMTWHVASAAIRSPGVHSGTTSVENFAVRSLKAIDEDVSGNFVYSPIGLATILGVASMGAVGHTKYQLDSVLKRLFERVERREINYRTDEYDDTREDWIRMATKLFLPNGFQLKPAFTAAIVDLRTGVQNVDFGNPLTASKTINDWCAAETNNLIKNLVTPGDFSGAVSLVLANAIYFKNDWLNTFDSRFTTDRTFYVQGTTAEQVPTMVEINYYRVGELPEVKAKFIEIPYKYTQRGVPLSMFIILPNENNGIKNLIKNFEKVTMQKLHEGISRGGKLFLPKFKIEANLDLSRPLAKMGLGGIFGGSANFSNIADGPALTVSKFVQKNFIDVNEEGTVAAGVTGVALGNHRLITVQFNFTVDHPFISIIADDTGIVYFTAVIVDPRS